ncbi:hypothetical protein DC357_00310 [Vibrio vulnificus]|nr:hypothetical protein DC357_00310 [Vibrio vulnificus]RAH22319.1 hypothetical protein DOT36_15490 [Vibrio vulnificus]
MIPPSYLKLSRCWLRFFPQLHSLSMLMGINSLAAYLHTPSSLGINKIKGFIGCRAILCAQHNG